LLDAGLREVVNHVCFWDEKYGLAGCKQPKQEVACPDALAYQRCISAKNKSRERRLLADPGLAREEKTPLIVFFDLQGVGHKLNVFPPDNDCWWVGLEEAVDAQLGMFVKVDES
jgi:hypothetical protein